MLLAQRSVFVQDELQYLMLLKFWINLVGWQNSPFHGKEHLIGPKAIWKSKKKQIQFFPNRFCLHYRKLFFIWWNPKTRLSDSIWHDSLMPLPLCAMVSENDSSQKCIRSKQRRLLFVSVFLFFYLQINLCVWDLKKIKHLGRSQIQLIDHKLTCLQGSRWCYNVQKN